MVHKEEFWIITFSCDVHILCLILCWAVLWEKLIDVCLNYVVILTGDKWMGFCFKYFLNTFVVGWDLILLLLLLETQEQVNQPTLNECYVKKKFNNKICNNFFFYQIIK